MVEIGLTDLPKSGCAMAYPAHPETTGLLLSFDDFFIRKMQCASSKNKVVDEKLKYCYFK